MGRQSNQTTLSDKHIFITGASSGLGRAVTIALAPIAGSLLISARRSSILKTVKQEASTSQAQILSYSADLSKASEIKQLCDYAKNRLGHIDIIINCGAAFNGGPALHNVPLSDWNHMINTNLRAPYLIARHLVPGMISNSYGKIVNITSATNHAAGIGTFRISKIGLEVATACLADELKGTGIATFAFNPNWMKSGHSDSGHHPRGAASAIVELLQRSTKQLNGNFFDLEWPGRKYHIAQRRRKPGQYGFDKINADSAVPTFWGIES